MFEYSSTLEPGSVESRSGFYRVTLRVVIESRYPERDSTVPGSRYSDCYMSVTKCEHLRMGASPGTNAQVFAVNKDNKRERERDREVQRGYKY